MEALNATKSQPPQLRPGLLLRPHLLERLDASLAGALTIVAAPAGFGKTTLLASWLLSGGRRAQSVERARFTVDDQAAPESPKAPRSVAWLNLDADDNDPARLLRGMIAALRGVDPSFGSALLAQLHAPQPPTLEALLPALADELAALPGRSVLVLDDYHLITAPAIHQALGYLIEHRPPQLHLVVATRSAPPLPLARLRAQGQLCEIRSGALRFSHGESAAFLREAMRLDLADADALRLAERTEGWAAGLQLAALALQDHPDPTGFIRAFSGSSRFIVDYLAEEVLARLPAHLQRFVLETAILDRLSGPLCDAVLGVDEGEPTGAVPPSDGHGSYSQIIIEQLEQANLFLEPLDDERRWYRYHQLFAEVMRDRLHSGIGVAALASLHQRASAWLAAHELLPEAIGHALAASDFSAAAPLIERYGTAIFARNEVLPQIEGWLAALPEASLHERPGIAVVRAWLLINRFDIAGAERAVADAERTLSSVEAPCEHAAGAVAATRAVVESLRQPVQPERVIAAATQALAQLQPEQQAFRGPISLSLGRAYLAQGNPARASRAFAEAVAIERAAGHTNNMAIALLHQSYAQRAQGSLTQALASARRALAQAEEQGAERSWVSWKIKSNLADMLYERNDLDAALAMASAGVGPHPRWVGPHMRLFGQLSLVQVQLGRGEIAAALDTLEEVRSLATPATACLLVLADGLEARARLARGEIAAALRWARGTDAEAAGSVDSFPELRVYAYECCWAVRIQVLLAYARASDDSAALAEILALLRPQAQLAAERGLGWLLLKAHVLAALTYSALGDAELAQRELAEALRLAAPEGYIRSFIDEGAPMAELLSGALSRDVEPEYVRSLLDACGLGLERASVAQQRLPATLAQRLGALVEPLTSREIEVLRLVASGASNGDIARALVISLGTVKKHVNNIFGKLAVQSRTQAILRARDLHLIEM